MGTRKRRGLSLQIRSPPSAGTGDTRRERRDRSLNTYPAQNTGSENSIPSILGTMPFTTPPCDMTHCSTGSSRNRRRAVVDSYAGNPCSCSPSTLQYRGTHVPTLLAVIPVHCCERAPWGCQYTLVTYFLISRLFSRVHAVACTPMPHTRTTIPCVVRR
jgi:hypothetical protein